MLGSMLGNILCCYGSIKYFYVLSRLTEKGIYHLDAFMRFWVYSFVCGFLGMEAARCIIKITNAKAVPASRAGDGNDNDLRCRPSCALASLGSTPPLGQSSRSLVDRRTLGMREKHVIMVEGFPIHFKTSPNDTVTLLLINNLHPPIPLSFVSFGVSWSICRGYLI
jgi:hypothetical protein